MAAQIFDSGIYLQTAVLFDLRWLLMKSINNTVSFKLIMRMIEF